MAGLWARPWVQGGVSLDKLWGAQQGIEPLASLLVSQWRAGGGEGLEESIPGRPG